jgi:hypothetical protein
MKRLWVAALFALTLGACAKEERWFESEVDIVRISVVRRDDSDTPLTSDVEVSYEQCPGSQLEVVRGGKAFSACMAKHKVGDRVKAKIHWYFGDKGYYESRVLALGDCERPVDPADEASFITVRDCGEWRIHGALVGFECLYLDKHKLNAACPWFKRR